MKLRRFCAKCGKAITDDKQKKVFSHEYLCEDCYQEKYGTTNSFPLPGKLTLRECKMCGAYSLLEDQRIYSWRFKNPKKKPVDFLSEILYNDVYHKIEKKHNIDYSLYFKQNLNLKGQKDIEYLLDGKKDGLKFNESMLIRRRKVICDYCAKKIGGRFTSVIQVRIQHERDENKIPILLKECRKFVNNIRIQNPKNLIIDVGKTNKGFNLKLSTNNLMKKLAHFLRSKHHFEMKVSKKLMGVDSEDGSKLYRYFTSLKLIPIQVGDIIVLENDLLAIDKITDKKIIVRDQETDQLHQVNFNVFEKKKWRFYEG